MAILSKACKPDNFESHNSLKLSFRNIWGLYSNFVDCESFLESNSPEILALWETNQILHGTYVSKTLQIFNYVFDWLYLTQCLTSFPSIDHVLRLCAWFLILFHLIRELSIEPSTYVGFFWDLNMHHKDWLTYSDGADWPGELCYNFSISNDLAQIVNFPTQIPDWFS